MADFTSEFWSWFIIVMTIVGIAACFLLTWWMSGSTGTEPDAEVQTMGHVWDEDLEELNNPLPKWWLNMFYITLVFGIIYLILYPGLGTFAGVLGWTAQNQYEQEIDLATNRYEALYAEYLERDIATNATDPDAVGMGERLYVTYCTVCHGSDAGGVRGYPNLRDSDWLWGGSPEQIKQTILDGRQGLMPAWGGSLGEDGVREVTSYVLQLAGREHDPAQAEAGKARFETFCVACHMADGSGNQALGAPNLTNDIWLYGGTAEDIAQSISGGRAGKMPAHREFLGEARAHLLATYVYSLSQP